MIGLAEPGMVRVHTPIMVREVVRALDPRPGDVLVDCTLGGGAHAEALLPYLQPGGRFIGIDVDSMELPRTEARLRSERSDSCDLTICHASFADLRGVLLRAGVAAADAILVDLGVSSMQSGDPRRGFSFRVDGPLDMRLNPAQGETAAALLARLDEPVLAQLLIDNADEPNAALLARALKAKAPASTQALDRVVRAALLAEFPDLGKPPLKMSVRRTLQALRIAVNHEMTALESLLAALPACLAPGGRVAFLTFHSGEDRRVKKAFQAGFRSGIYTDYAREVVRSDKAETWSNRRAASAKLRWARRAAA